MTSAQQTQRKKSDSELYFGLIKHINPNKLNRDKQFTPTYICRNAKKRGGCGHKFNLTLLDKEQGQAK